jgi:hypothetical protein
VNRDGWLKTEVVDGHYHWYQPSEEMSTTSMNIPMTGNLPEIFHQHMLRGAIGTTTSNQAEKDSDFHFHPFPAHE